MIARNRIVVRQRFTKALPKEVKGPLEHGNICHERGAPGKLGKIAELGPEVSGVKFDTGESRYISNKQIVNLGKAKP